jgi:hypothetical protein
MGASIELQNVPEGLVARIDARARQTGVDRQTYLLRLIQQDLSDAVSGRPLAEILEPVHHATEEKGLSVTEIENFLSEEMAATRRARRDPTRDR